MSMKTYKLFNRFVALVLILAIQISYLPENVLAAVYDREKFIVNEDIDDQLLQSLFDDANSRVGNINTDRSSYNVPSLDVDKQQLIENLYKGTHIKNLKNQQDQSKDQKEIIDQLVSKLKNDPDLEYVQPDNKLFSVNPNFPAQQSGIIENTPSSPGNNGKMSSDDHIGKALEGESRNLENNNGTNSRNKGFESKIIGDSKKEVELLFTGEIDKNEKIFTKFQLKSSISYEKAQLIIFEKGLKNTVFDGFVDRQGNDVRIDNLVPGKNYVVNVKIFKRDAIDSYIGLINIDYRRNKESGHINTIYSLSKVFKYSQKPLDTVNTAVYNDLLMKYETVDESVYSSNNLQKIQALAASYEYEPNDAFQSAGIIYDDDDVYGRISSQLDVDYFKVKFSNPGNANFWLGNIPYGQDYDISLYDDSYNLIGESEFPGNADELISSYPVKANRWYFVKIFGYNGSYDASTYYHLRAKNYPIEPVVVNSLTSNKPSPQPVNTPITWTCSASGGTSLKYEFRVYHSSTGWQLGQAMSPSNSYTWTPTVAGDYWIAVTAWDEAYATSAGTYTSFTIEQSPVTVHSLYPDKSSPQYINTPITWTCDASGGTSIKYQFSVYHVSTGWQLVQSMSPANSYRWTPTIAGTYSIAVIAWDELSNSSDGVSTSFIIEQSPVTIHSLTPDKPSPQYINTPITWTCDASGAHSLEYRFAFYTSATGWQYTELIPFNYFTWTPTVAGDYYVAVIAVDRTANYSQSLMTNYTIHDINPVTVNSLTSDKSSPQLVHKPITWTCDASGGVALEYSFYVARENDDHFSMAQDFSPSNTFTWIPTIAGDYRIVVLVWDKTINDSGLAYDDYTIAEPVKINSLTTDKPSPQSVNTPIAWICDASGGISLEYAFFISHDGGNFQWAQEYSPSNTFNWNPTAGGDYRIAVMAWDRALNDYRSILSDSFTITQPNTWYYLELPDNTGGMLRVYLSDIGSVDSTADDVTAKVISDGDTLLSTYELNSGNWICTDQVAYTPGGDIGICSVTPLSSTVSAMSILDIDFEGLKEDIKSKILDKLELSETELTSDDIHMIYYGILIGLDDNLAFGIGQWVNHQNYLPEDNFYFMRAKTVTDTVFVASYAQVALGSASAAAAFLADSGKAALCAAATSPTGVGTAVFGTEAVGELAAAGFLAGISIISTQLSERSYNILQRDMQKLEIIPRFRVFRGIKARNIVEKTAEEANAFWMGQQYTYPPYKYNTKVFEFNVTEETTFVRVFKEGSTSGVRGQWMMRANDIKGLAPEQIKDKFSLMHVPDRIAEVKIYTNNNIRGGIAREIEEYNTTGGGIQFDLMGNVLNDNQFILIGDLLDWLAVQ